MATLQLNKCDPQPEGLAVSSRGWSEHRERHPRNARPHTPHPAGVLVA